MATRYVGRRLGDDGPDVTVIEGDTPLGPLPHFELHSPDGFEWGYSGSGPTELARCILIHHLGLVDRAEANPKIDLAKFGVNVNDFRDATVAQFPRESNWTITEQQVKDALDSIGAEIPEF